MELKELINLVNEIRVSLGIQGQVEVVERERERKQIKEWCVERIRNKEEKGILYVYGKPGTGKTATVNKVIRELGSEFDVGCSVRFVQMNCNSGGQLNKSVDISFLLLKKLKEFGIKKSPFEPGSNPSEIWFHLKQSLCSGKSNIPKIILVLDEIDGLKLDLHSVSPLFELTCLPNSRLCLIGISNELKLTEQIFPVLSSLDCSPEILPFDVYTIHQLKGIVRSRLDSCGEGHKVFNENAINLVCSQISKHSGDARKVLGVLQNATTIFLEDLQQLPSNDSPCNAAQALPKITCKHTRKALTPFSQSDLTAVRGLSPHAKVMLCSVYTKRPVTKHRNTRKRKIRDEDDEDLCFSLEEWMFAYRQGCNAIGFRPKETKEVLTILDTQLDGQSIKLGRDKRQNISSINVTITKDDVSLAFEGNKGDSVLEPILPLSSLSNS